MQPDSMMDYGGYGHSAPVVLHVAEKPSVAAAVATALAGNGGAATRKGMATDIHEFPASFKGGAWGF